MKHKNLLFAIVLGVVLPWLIFNTIKPTVAEPEYVEPVTGKTQDILEFSVLLEDGSVQNMTMETYLLGVLMGEMPASFEMEALKAQAVASRTFTCKSVLLSKHAQAAVCTSASCCQAYLTRDEYTQKGGRQQDIDKLQQAIAATAGEVLVYDDELIIATYFSCSGGRTEPAVAVWGMDLPYLQAVESPGEELAAHYMDIVQFTKEEFETLLSVDLSSGVGEYEYSDGGGVVRVRIGDQYFSGAQLRQLLGLRSTALSISVGATNVEITTKGFGHRVGMSQYGANFMAAQNADYVEILSYYYRGATIRCFDEMMV